MAKDYESLIEPIKSKRTFEEVSNRLKELIFQGVLRPGHKLPSENALAQMFQVGRQSVREALRVLELSGFITVRGGVKGGPVIADTVLSKIADLFLNAFKFNKVSLEDFVTARCAIERSVLDSLFKNADRSDIESLRNNIREANAKQNEGKLAFEENIDFHRLLAKASKNFIFSIVMESLLTVLSDFRSKLTAVGGIERSRQVTEIHEAILEAIVAKKKRKAIALIDEDLSTLTELLVGNSDE
jgi:GntR family transcriptional repressor for pyruvate dehydrogenase complex